MQELPYPIAKYIRDHYPECCVSDFEPVNTPNNLLTYKIKINENDLSHHLEFDEKGKLKKKCEAVNRFRGKYNIPVEEDGMI